jgi:hypothetical protein
MNKKKIWPVVGTIGGLAIAFCLMNFFTDSKAKEDTGIEKNYGVAYGISQVKVNNDKVEVNAIDLKDIIPSVQVLLKNLDAKGYEIETYDLALDDRTKATRVFAKQGDKFIDISYCNSTKDAVEAFKSYEDKYKDYYIMAQNDKFIYCISDTETFDIAGFESLYNVGIQYINHDKE